MGKVIAVSNQKGGVGKSTTVVNLAAVFGAKGSKVLIIDFDPQGNTTTSFGISKKSIRNTVYDVLLGDCPLQESVVASAFRGVSVVPTTQDLASASVQLLTMENRAMRLKECTDYAGSCKCVGAAADDGKPRDAPQGVHRLRRILQVRRCSC